MTFKIYLKIMIYFHYINKLLLCFSAEAVYNVNLLFRLHRMHEMQTIVTDVSGVCPSVCLTRGYSAARAVCAGLFDAAFTKTLWPFVIRLLLLTLKLSQAFEYVLKRILTC